MKKAVLFTLLSFFVLSAQESAVQNKNVIEVGDILVLGNPSTKYYQHVHFPKTNFIIKKGGIPNYKTIVGSPVVVTEVTTNNEGQTKVALKKVNGKKFFNSILIVNATLEKALDSKEIVAR